MIAGMERSARFRGPELGSDRERGEPFKWFAPYVSGPSAALSSYNVLSPLVYVAGRNITLKSKSDALVTLARLRVEVAADRSGHARNQTDMDWYCARAYLQALARSDRLAYPIRIEQGESPDFLLRWPGWLTTGLEVTSVTSPEVERRLAADDPFPWGNDGWQGNELEHGLVQSLLRSVDNKCNKLARGKFRFAARHDLLLYNSAGFVFARMEIAIPLIRSALRDYDPPPSTSGILGVVSILDDGGTVRFHLRGEFGTINNG